MPPSVGISFKLVRARRRSRRYMFLGTTSESPKQFMRSARRGMAFFYASACGRGRFKTCPYRRGRDSKHSSTPLPDSGSGVLEYRIVEVSASGESVADGCRSTPSSRPVASCLARTGQSPALHSHYR